MILLRKHLKGVDTLLVLLGTILFGIGLAYFVDYYYDINDDLLMKDILAGVYTGSPSGYNIQMLYPLSKLISLFYAIDPNVSWYGLFLCGGHLLCIFLIGKRLVTVTDIYWKKILLLLVEYFILLGALLYELTFIQYTISCGLFAATGAFWFYTSDDSLSIGQFLKENSISILLVIIAFYMRTEMLLLVFPLICVLGFCKWSLSFSKESNLKYVVVIGSILLGMGVGLLSNHIAYGEKSWRNFNELFDSRTEIYDFLDIPNTEYDENKEIYQQVGLSPSEYVLIQNYNYILDKSINHKMLQQIENLYKESGVSYFKLDSMKGLQTVKYRLTHKMDAPWVYLVWVCYFAIAIVMIMNKRWSFLWKISLLFGARSISWMYIIMRARVLPRITVPLYLVEFSILVAILLMECKDIAKDNKPLYRRFFPVMVASMLCILALGSLTKVIPKVQEEQVRRNVINKEWQSMQAYCRKNPENLYLLDCYSTVKYSEKMFVDVNNDLANYQYAGGWACKSPIEVQKLKVFGITEVETDLYEKENLFFISYGSRSVDWLKVYYRTKGITVEIISVDTIPFESNDTYEIYQVKKIKQIRQIIPLYQKERNDVN